jgi:hypothetical protein
MPDTPNSVPPSPAGPAQASKPAAAPPDAGHVPMTEELDRAKWTLPPIVPVLGAAALIAVVVGILAITMHTKPVASTSIVKMVTADQIGNTMVGVQVKIDNKIEKLLWIKDISSELETADGNKYPDHATPSTDYARYLQAFPPLREVKSDPLREELKIPAGTSYTGYTIFSYPVNQAAFAGRKALTIRIELYDQPTLVLKQP